MGGAARGKTNNPFKEAWWHTRTGGHRRFLPDAVKPPDPIKPPPPADESDAYFRALSLMQTERGLRKSQGRQAAFGKSVLGG